MSPVLAGHVRLQQGEYQRSLREAYERAPEGPEKHTLPDKLGVRPASIGDAGFHTAMLAVIHEQFGENHDKVLAEIEAFNKLVGAEYVLRGEEMFPAAAASSSRRRRHRWAGKMFPGFGCGDGGDEVLRRSGLSRWYKASESPQEAWRRKNRRNCVAARGHRHVEGGGFFGGEKGDL